MSTTDRALLKIDVKNAADLRQALDRKEVALKHKGNAMHKAVILVDRWVQKNFQTEGQSAYPGKGWQPLAELTIAARMRTNRVQRAAANRGKTVQQATLKILQVNGQLRSRWRSYWNDRQGILQSAVDYGIYHDSDEPRTRLPERKILPTEKQIMPEIVKIFGEHIETSLKK